MRLATLLSGLAIIGPAYTYLCIEFLGCVPNCPDEQARCDLGPEYCINGNAGCWEAIITEQTTVVGADSTVWTTATTTIVISTTNTATEVAESTSTVTEVETQRTTIEGSAVTTTVVSTELFTITEAAAAARREAAMNPKFRARGYSTTYVETVDVYYEVTETQWITETSYASYDVTVTSVQCCDAATVTSITVEMEAADGSTVTETSTATATTTAQTDSSPTTAAQSGGSSGETSTVSVTTTAGGAFSPAAATSTNGASLAWALGRKSFVTIAGLAFAVIPGLV